MPPLARTLPIPRLLHLGEDCLADVARLLAAHDFDLSHVLVGSGPGPSRPLAREVVAGLSRSGVRVRECPDLTGRLDQAASAAATIIEQGVTTAVAVGGGRVIDVVKLAAARTGIEFVSVPTTISNDGISSPVASLTDRSDARTSYAARMPTGIVVDVATVGTAPCRTIRAGTADLVSNLVACLDWRLADRLGHDRYDAYSAMIAESAARPVLDLADVDSPDAHRVLANGLILSGLAMAAAGTSRPCSGAEHLVSHALDALLGGGAALHGEQVALGCLIATAAHSSPLLPQLRALFARIGLPGDPAELGIPASVLVEAVANAPDLRPDRWTILSENRGTRAAEALVEQAFAEPPAVLPLRPGSRRHPRTSRRMRSSARSVA